MTFEEFIKEVIVIIQESGIMHFLFSVILPFSAVIIAFKIAIRCVIRCVREPFIFESRYNNKKIKARDDVVCETRSDEDDADDDADDGAYGESDQPHGFW